MTDRTLRFAVGDSGGLSSNSWRIWVKPDGDVYIKCRDNYKELKVSLHGHRWRVGFSQEGAASIAHLPNKPDNRAWMVWNRPGSVGGITMGYRVLFFPSELELLPEHRPHSKWRDVQFAPVGAFGTVTVATITLNEGDSTFVFPGVDQWRDFLPLPEGGRVQLTIHTEDLDERFLQGVMIGYRNAVMSMHEQKVSVPITSRIFLAGNGGDGQWPFATEINLARPAADPLHLLND